MAENSTRTIRWGILATGAIAETFSRDLLVDPRTRGVNHLSHTIVAVASSSDAKKASELLRKVKASPAARAYGSYAELVADEAVEIVYIATPHSHHYPNARLALEAGKHVLCEKPFTVNAGQARILADLARKRNLLLMEGMWTRYFPLSQYVRDVIRSGRIGRVHRVMADLSGSMYPETSFADGQHRMINENLAGGSLLDLGIYSITWCFQALYSTQSTQLPRQRPRVMAAMKEYTPTGVDEMSTLVLVFPRSPEDGGAAHGIAMSGLRVATDPGDAGQAGPAIRIQGEKGELQLNAPIYRPDKSKIILADGTVESKEWPHPGPGPGTGWYNGFMTYYHAEGEGHGMFWEADDAGNALIEGRTEGSQLGLDESILIAELLDSARQQGNIRYPEALETLQYPFLG